jgi:VWFA-related protein
VGEAQRRDVVIDAIGLFGSDAKAATGRHQLDQLTHETGGRAYFPADVGEVDKVMTDLALQIRNQYVIAYAPLNQALDGSYRTIRVTANETRRGRLDVHTRAGYLASAG